MTTRVADYTRLTGEPAIRFQAFSPGEIVAVISTFEEMPAGFHAVAGLTTLVRRSSGGSAPVVASTSGGYLEVTGAAFAASDDELHRAMVREKARFIVTPELEAAWSAIRTDETLPEAIADYVSEPNVMRNRTVAGFELIHDQVMTGGLELDPDAMWPGQVIGVAVRTLDQPDVGTRVIVELALRTDASTFTGAASAAIRIYSEAGSSAVVSLAPVTESGSVVRGEIVLDAPADAGFWRPDQIVVRGRSGTPLVHSAVDLGWKLYID